MSLNLPWRRWDLHIVDSKGKAIAFNVGVENANAIVEAMNRRHFKTEHEMQDSGFGKK